MRHNALLSPYQENHIGIAIYSAAAKWVSHKRSGQAMDGTIVSFSKPPSSDVWWVCTLFYFLFDMI